MAGLTPVANTEHIWASFLGCRLAQFPFYGLSFAIACCQPHERKRMGPEN